MKRPERSPEDRLWDVLLWVGAVAGTAFLGLHTFEYFADAARPGMQRNDVTSGLASVAMLVIVAVIAGRREQVRRAAAAAGSGVAKGAKRAGRRRKGRT